MKQLIYGSQPFGFDRAMLAGILVGARRNNARDDITGALICRHDLYLQLIAGPDTAIDALYTRILRDDRHSDVRLLLSDTVEQRIFPEWRMLDDEMPSMSWSPAEVTAGAVEAASAAALREIFERVAATARERAAKVD
ncbi:BLUF domain-containing protein [Sphingomonas sp.]|uniref:BLUF domain-containing protein n=1 Tax=Sphingomonas sp. TaxID=28214 RepID=UPI0033409D7E